MDPDQRDALIRAHKDAGKIEGVETSWRRRDGNAITVRLSGRTIRDPDDRVEAFEMMVEDVTERRALEAQLRQAQKMEAVGQLTGGIAHDFNNQLSVITLNAEFVKQALESGGAVEAPDIDEILQASKRAARMTQQLLGFSRRSELKIGPTDLAEVVGGLSKVIGALLRENIRYRFQREESVPLAQVDVGAVEQILVNLVANARDAMPLGGSLEISLSEVELDEAYCAEHPYAAPGRYVQVRVQDTGTGMDEETRKRIFEPFYTTKPKGVGTGLGMAMVYGLVKQQTGTIELESEPEVGTTFLLYFPVVSEAAVDGENAEASTGAEGGTETILLVEDEPSVRASGTKALQRAGYTVLTAQDGQEGFDLLLSSHREVDLILCDLVMPRMGGSQLYKRIQEEGQTVPFILSTGHSSRDDTPHSDIPETVPTVTKPWNQAELLTVVRDVLDGTTPPFASPVT
jgi:signal transduction histidine kinase